MTPVPPTLGLAPGSDTGISPSDNITYDTTPAIIGTAAPGSTVTLTDANSTLALTTQADKNDNFMFGATASGKGTGVGWHRAPPPRGQPLTPPARPETAAVSIDRLWRGDSLA